MAEKGSAQRRICGIWSYGTILRWWPWSLRSPNTTIEEKSNDPSTRLWEINQTTFQHFTCNPLFKQASHRRPLRGRRGHLSLSLSLLICSVRAPVAYSIWGIGRCSMEGSYCEEHFQSRDIPVVTFGFSFLSYRPSICKPTFLSRTERDGSLFFFCFSSPPLVPATGSWGNLF